MIKNFAEQIVSQLNHKLEADVLDYEVESKSDRQVLLIWFRDYERRGGPIFQLSNYALKKHQVELRFGSFSKDCQDIIMEASSSDHPGIFIFEKIISTIQNHSTLNIDGVAREDWKFSLFDEITIVKKLNSNPHSLDSYLETTVKIIFPLVFAFIEILRADKNNIIAPIEGETIEKVSKSYERSKKQRDLCLLLQGTSCKVCGLNMKEKYKLSDEKIEVHHIEPLSELRDAKVYNPITDLIPICPNCHEAIHSEKPALTPDQLKARLSDG